MAVEMRNADVLPWSMYGFILQWVKDEEKKEHLYSQLERISCIRRLDFAESTGLWSAFEYRSDLPLSRNDSGRLEDYKASGLSSAVGGGDSIGTMRDPRPFRYTFLLRYNAETGMAAIASEGRDVSQNLIDRVLNERLSPRLFPVQVRVSDLATHFVNESDGKFKLSYISADFIDGGADVEKVTFYGKDIGNSVFVHENIHRFSAVQIGMRLSSEFKENAQFGTDGYIRFYPRKGIGLVRFESCLSYVAAQRFFVFSS